MGSSDADSSDESEEVIRNGDISESSSTENTKSKASEGVTNGSETDSEDEGAGIEKDDVVVTNGNSVSDDAEDLEALQPKRVSKYQSLHHCKLQCYLTKPTVMWIRS